ncbi:hypothetical protein OSB04_002851 [Centaurea solstitialis]|uniref:Uncharacterized protein n=1 Tax=Centaurea solstitialis TaxID=347529 RepID=A0AA38WTF6_9ASTR|nr:hypothetical protein OSB04_002851 [Centaurea solstitialis]
MAQPGYLNDSSSTDTDEDWEQDAQIFAHLVQQANASSSIRRSKAPNIDRGRVEANARLMADYFDDNPTYPEKTFKRRFRMSRNLFTRIVYDLYTRYPYFQQQYDATGLPGLSTHQKCTAAIRQLAYGITGDAWDDYVRMGESTARKCLNHFVEGIIQMYGKVYLRKPTYEDIQQLYAAHDDRHGFPGMLGSLDCMHWEWAMCPVAWQGQYHRGDKPHPSIILEAAASQDTWIWHAFFGCPGAMNDLNVLNHSPIFEDVYNGIAPDRTFQVNGATYKHEYYLGDGIYHEWATFVKAFSYPEDDKRIKFKGAQEAARKDIERAFGILRKRWNIIKQPSRFMEIPTMRKVMYACIILHNMILENKNKAICVVPNDIPDPPNPQLTEEQPSAVVTRRQWRTAAAAAAAEFMRKAIRFVQSTIVFTEGRNDTVSRVSSSKSLENNMHDQTLSKTVKVLQAENAMEYKASCRPNFIHEQGPRSKVQFLPLFLSSLMFESLLIYMIHVTTIEFSPLLTFLPPSSSSDHLTRAPSISPMDPNSSQPLQQRRHDWHSGYNLKKSTCHHCHSKPVSLLDDVESAFLNGDLSAEVYMKQPPEISHSKGRVWVCRLCKALYGIKQAPWFNNSILSSGFSSSENGCRLFTRTTEIGIILLLLYVDDMIIGGSDTADHLSRAGIYDSKDFALLLASASSLAIIDMMEDVGQASDLSQTAPLLKTEKDPSVVRKRMKTLFHVVYLSQIFKASLPAAYVHHEATKRTKPAVDGKNDNKREIILKIVREKNLQALEDFGGLTRVADALNTDLIKGISNCQAAINSSPVSLSPTPPNRFSHHVFKSIKNKTILLLSLAALLSLGFGIVEEGLQYGWYDGVFVLFTIILLVLLASIRKYRQEHKDRNRSEANLQHVTYGRDVEVHVIREGERKYVCESKLVCGDVILLNKGCQVPADGLFVQGQDLELDYESESCIIDERNPFLSYGERVINGDATMVVICINLNTRWSEMMSKATGDSNMRFKLETHIDKLNTCIHYTGLIISILILVVLFFRYLAGKMDEENGYKLESIAKPTAAKTFANTYREIVKDSKYTARALTRLLSVSLIGVTEGVPFVISLAIFYWNHIALSGNNAIEQDSQAVAKMGSTTRICSDFTENQMEVERIFIGGKVISACTTLSADVVEALCGGFCTSKETAVLAWAKEKFGLKREGISMPGLTNTYENGSVKEILNKCTHYYHATGEKSPMDDTMRSSFDQDNEGMQHKQLKTIAFACNLTDADDDFILVAIIGLKSTSMEVIKAEVMEFRDRGIETVIVSSKKLVVLKDIALQCGVIAESTSESLVIISGEAFRAFSEDERIEKVDKIRVLGEAIPSDKLLLIETLRKKGEVVAFIGQRTDEAPILRKADIGISIGTWSSRKARESSDIFICEYGSFHDLINIINSGKCIHYNVQRFLQLVLITTVSSTLISFYETVAFGDASLTTFELVCVNLAVDFLGGFALLTISSTTDKQVPSRRGSGSLITAEMTRNILFQVLYQVSCSVILQLKGSGTKIMVSSSFILSQFFNQFNARELQKKNFFKGIHQHKEFWVSVATFIVVHAALVIGGQDVLGYGTSLNWKQWAGCVGVGVMTWLVDWFGKCMPLSIMILIKGYIARAMSEGVHI